MTNLLQENKEMKANAQIAHPDKSGRAIFLPTLGKKQTERVTLKTNKGN